MLTPIVILLLWAYLRMAERAARASSDRAARAAAEVANEAMAWQRAEHELRARNLTDLAN